MIKGYVNGANGAQSFKSQLFRRQEATPQIQTDGGLPPQQSLLKRMSKHPSMMHYNRLIVLVLVVNLAVLGVGLWRRRGRG